MNFADARRLVIAEGIGEQGLTLAVRMSDIPDAHRMRRLLDALQIVFNNFRGESSLDRELASALFCLAFHVQGDIDGHIDRGIELRPTFVDDEMVRMFLLIESIFEDEDLHG